MSQQVPANPPQSSPAGPRPPAMFWAVAIVIVAAMICGTYLLTRLVDLGERVVAVPSQMASVPARMVEGIALAFKPTINVHTTIDTTIASVRQQSSLVVLKAAINVTLTRESEKSTMWGKVYLGTTTVFIRALDNRIQYVVPLEKFDAKDVVFDAETKTLVVKIPSPRLDEDLVEVQSDPSKMSVQTDVGWARMDSFSGRFLRDQAMRDLRPSVIQQGKHPLLLDRARVNAKEDMLKLLSPLIGELRDDVKVEVRFAE